VSRDGERRRTIFLKSQPGIQQGCARSQSSRVSGHKCVPAERPPRGIAVSGRRRHGWSCVDGGARASGLHACRWQNSQHADVGQGGVRRAGDDPVGLRRRRLGGEDRRPGQGAGHSAAVSRRHPVGSAHRSAGPQQAWSGRRLRARPARGRDQHRRRAPLHRRPVGERARHRPWRPPLFRTDRRADRCLACAAGKHAIGAGETSLADVATGDLPSHVATFADEYRGQEKERGHRGRKGGDAVPRTAG